MSSPPTFPLADRARAPALSHTKIIATIGPATEDRVGELIDAGMSVARINLSHGTEEDFLRRVRRIRKEADARMRAIGILTDISGPKLRLARFEGGKRDLAEGERLRLRRGSGVSPAGEVHLDFGGFLDALAPGHRIILADGQAELVVENVESESVLARVTREGEIGDRKGVHFPDSRLAYEIPTEQDKRNLARAAEAGVDMIGASFVSRPEEIRAIRALIPDAIVIAKIERMAALENLEALLAEADGLMVARGDLGVEADLEQLPLIQKTVIAAAIRAGKFAITATEMLESMVESTRPTRAEVTDVANAVLDGSDAVMLSAETAVGEHPIESVATMRKIAVAVETSQRYQDLPRPPFRLSEANFGNATALAAVQAAGGAADRQDRVLHGDRELRAAGLALPPERGGDRPELEPAHGEPDDGARARPPDALPPGKEPRGHAAHGFRDDARARDGPEGGFDRLRGRRAARDLADDERDEAPPDRRRSEAPLTARVSGTTKPVDSRARLPDSADSPPGMLNGTRFDLARLRSLGRFLAPGEKKPEPRPPARASSASRAARAGSARASWPRTSRPCARSAGSASCSSISTPAREPPPAPRLAPRHDLGHVLDGTVPAREAVVHGPAGVHLLSGGVGRHALANPTRRELDRLFQALRPLEQEYDLVIIDHGAGISYGTVAHWPPRARCSSSRTTR
jgi:pyruvate kinase